MVPGADETELRAQLMQFAVPGSAEEVESVRGEREVDDSVGVGEEDVDQLSPFG